MSLKAIHTAWAKGQLTRQEAIDAVTNREDSVDVIGELLTAWTTTKELRREITALKEKALWGEPRI